MRLILILTFLFACYWLSAQEDTDEQVAHKNAQKKVCVFLSTDISASSETNRYQDIITDAIEVEFRNVGFSIIPREEWREVQTEMELSSTETILGSNAIKISRRVEADFAVTGFYMFEANRLLLEIKCYDAELGRLVAGNMQSGRLGLSTYNLINEVVSSMIPDLQTAHEPLPPLERLPDERLHEVSLLSNDEDAEVFINGEELIGKVRNGIVNQIVVKDTELIIETRKEGYHNRRDVIKQEGEEKNYRLGDLMKKTRWASEILYTSGQALGIGMGLRFYIIPDQLFISLEDYFYVQHDFREASQPVFHDDIKLLVGDYLFFGPSSIFRIGVSAGFGIVLTGFSVPDMPVHTDFYLNVINGWIELNLKDWSLYFRTEGKYGIGIGNNLMGGRWYTVGNSVPPMTLGVVKKW